MIGRFTAVARQQGSAARKIGHQPRPEHARPACVRACPVTSQAALTRRALELLALPPGPSQGGAPRLLLDLGCGSGLSGAELSDEVGGGEVA